MNMTNEQFEALEDFISSIVYYAVQKATVGSASERNLDRARERARMELVDE